MCRSERPRLADWRGEVGGGRFIDCYRFCFGNLMQYDFRFVFLLKKHYRSIFVFCNLPSDIWAKYDLATYVFIFERQSWFISR